MKLGYSRDEVFHLYFGEWFDMLVTFYHFERSLTKENEKEEPEEEQVSILDL